MIRNLFRLSLVFTILITFNFKPAYSGDPKAALTQIIGEFVANHVSDARKKELQIVIENSAKFLLEATHKSEHEKLELFAQAQKYTMMKLESIFQNFQMEINGVPEERMNKILPPPAWTLKDEVEYMIKEGDSYQRTVRPEVLSLIDNFLENFDIEKLRDIELFDPKIAPQMMTFIEHLQNHIKNPNYTNSKSVGLAIVDTFEKEMDKHVKRIKNLGDELVAKVDPSTADKVDPRIVTFVQYFINDYYQSLSDDHLKNIISDFISLGPGASDEVMMQTMINNSGPTLGKTFQQLSEEPSIGAALNKYLAVLQSDGKKVPYHLVDKIIKSDTGGYKFISVDPEPLGTGTVAQVHKARIKYKGKEMDVAVRVIKPGTQELADLEMVFMRNFIDNRINGSDMFKGDNMPDFEFVLEKIQDFVQRDIDIPLAIERQGAAIEFYEHTEKIFIGDGKPLWEVQTLIPRVYPPENGQATNIQVQELVKFGKKFTKLDSEDAQKAVSRSMFPMWFEEALFKNGYTHYDLHPGNFTVIVESEGKIKLYIFDYGMTMYMPKESQRIYILFGIGSALKDPKMIRRAIMESNKIKGHKLNISKSELLEKIKAQDLKAKAKNAKMDPALWIMWAVKNKYIMAEEVGALGRGGMLVSVLPKLVADEEFTKKSIVKMGLRNLKRAFWDRSYKFPISMYERALAFKSSCKYLIKSFLFGK